MARTTACLPGGHPFHARPQVVQRAGSQDGAHLQAAAGPHLPGSLQETESKLSQPELFLVLLLQGLQEQGHLADPRVVKNAEQLVLQRLSRFRMKSKLEPVIGRSHDSQRKMRLRLREGETQREAHLCGVVVVQNQAQRLNVEVKLEGLKSFVVFFFTACS